MSSSCIRFVPWPLVGLLLLCLLAVGCRTPMPGPENTIEDESLLGCSTEAFAQLGRLDVAIVIDTSMSTQTPTGYDIDGDGTVGEIKGSTITDRQDTVLAAQIVGVRRLLEVMDHADVRLSIVTYAGVASAPARPDSRVVRNNQARIRAPLGEDRATLEGLLAEIEAGGSRGTTHFYAGMRRANRSLIEGEGPERHSRRFVLFISDSKGPTTREPDGRVTGIDVNLEVAARQAQRHGITFNTFGLSEDSGTWRFAPIGRIAGATGGNYHMVEDPHALYCHLANALLYPTATF